MDVTQLKQKIDDLKGSFDGWAWDSGAGSSGYDKAIDDVIALFPDGPALPESKARTLLRKMIQALDDEDHDLYFDTMHELNMLTLEVFDQVEKQ